LPPRDDPEAKVVEQHHTLVLASASPRRREILGQLGIAFEVRPSDIPEPPPVDETPRAYAERLAREKALAVCAAHPSTSSMPYVLAADTIVVVDGAVLGKPVDDADGRRMLRLLSGREHEVVTGVALARVSHGFVEGFSLVTKVRFRALTQDEVSRYIASGEGRDKAGSYAIQGLGTANVAAIDGSYSNVVGLPAAETLVMLQRHGIVGAWP
jgi:septum formation protein